MTIGCIFSFCHEYSPNVCVARIRNCPYYVPFISIDILCTATRFRIPSGECGKLIFHSSFLPLCLSFRNGFTYGRGKFKVSLNMVSIIISNG